MALIPVEVVISQHQECSLPLPVAASQGAFERPVRRNGSRRFLRALSAKRNRCWLLALVALPLTGVGAWAQNGVFITPQPVGVLSSAQSVTVTAQVAGSVATVDVLTLGAAGLDFSGVASSSGCPTANLTAAGQQCTESVTFKPTAPGLRMGAVVLLDGNKNVLGTAYLSGTGLGGLGVLVPGNVLTMAGVYRIYTSTKDGIPATQANLNEPASVTLDGAGNLYIADSLHNRIRRVAPPVPPATVGIISTYAGTGQSGYSGDNGLAAKATLDIPSGVALDGVGNLYIADTNNNVIRKVTAATGIITTVAGNGAGGYTGDNVAATSTELNQPKGITVDPGGNLFIADTYNQRIRRVDAVTGIITTVAGDGDPSGKGDGKGTYTGDGKPAIDAGLSLPCAVAFDDSGNMYIPDSANNVVRMVAAVSGAITATSTISTVVGFYPGNSGNTGDGGLATAALLWSPSGVAVDAAGNLYISDTQNSRIRKVNATTKDIATLVANGAGNTLAPGGTTPVPVQIFAPVGLFLDGSGDLYFADRLYMLVEQIQSDDAILNFTQTPVQVGDQSAPQLQTVENDGNAPLDLTKFEPDSNAAVDPATTTCSLTTPLAEDTDCQIGAVFAPPLDLNFPAGATSEEEDGNIDVYGNTVSYPANTLNFPLDIELVGVATPVNATQLVLTSNPNPSNFGVPVTFTATVTSGATAGTPVGNVAFTDTFNGVTTTLAASVGLNGQGVATFTTATPLAVGSHLITASFTGATTSNFLPSTNTLTQVVGEVTATTVKSSQNPAAVGLSVTFKATVSVTSGGGVPLDGAVTFTDTPTGGAAAPLGTPQTIGASGIATVSTAALTSGLHTITATYSGDATNGILGSKGSYSQDIQAPSTITLTSSAPMSAYGASITFTVTVPTIGTVPATGTVTILGTGLAPTPTVTLAGNPATGTFATSALAVGAYSLTASYGGDNYYSPSTSATVSQVVKQATTSTAVSAAPNPAVAGAPVTITATVKVTQGVSTPTGNVNFTDSLNGGAAAPLACTPQPTVAAPTCTTSVLTAGSHSIVATYVGDTDDAGSTSTPFALTVVAETISLSPSSNPSTYGTPVTFTVTVPTIGTVAATGTVNILEKGQGNPIGTVILAGNPGSGTFTTSSLPAGTDVITASYLGGPNYIPIVSAPLNQVVSKATTSTVVAAVPNPGIAGAPVAITATVTVTLGVATPTGGVSFTDSLNGGAPVSLGSPVLLAGGKATISVMLAPGSHSIVATYSGDANDNTSNATFALTVNQAVTTTVVTATPNPALVLSTVTFTAKVTSVGGGTPSGLVTFSAGSTSIGSAQLNAGTATITYSKLPVGTYTITAAYGGDANDQKSTGTAPAQLVVGKIPTVTDLGASTTGGATPQVILVAAVLNSAAANAGSLPTPTGTVTFNNGSTVIGSAPLDSSGVATFVPNLPTGTYNIVASYGGDPDHGASSSKAVSISTTAADFNLVVTPDKVTLAATQNVSVNVALNSTAGFADTIGLGCASLPAGINCHFSTPSVALPANGVVNVTLTIDTNNPLGGGTSARNAPHGGSRGVALAGLFLPLSVLFGCLFWRFRRRYARSISTALILLLGVAFLLATGCSGSFTQSSATPGTYTIQVTGTGVKSNISNYQNVTLTITAK